MRCFFAVAVDHHLGLELIGLRDRAMSHLGGADPRPVAADNFHLTLAFLGDLPEQRLPPLRECAAAIAARSHGGLIQFHSAHCFPDSRSRIFAVEGEPDPEILGFYTDLCRCIAEAGFPVEHRDFRPHITLARLRHSFVPSPQWPVELAIPVREFCLYESTRGHNGEIRYRVVDRWELAGE